EEGATGPGARGGCGVWVASEVGPLAPLRFGRGGGGGGGRAPADRGAEGDDDLVRRRSVRDRELDRQVMRALALVELVHERHHDRRVRSAAGIGEAEIALGADGFAEAIAEAERVDQRRGVLDLAGYADDRGLAIALD